jgi:hypothetical protein
MLKATLAVIFTIGISCQAINTDTKAFFETGKNPGKELPADKIYPQGRLFPFSFYSSGGISKSLLSDKERVADQEKIFNAGTTIIGPQYELNKRILEDAKKFKVKAIYTLKLKIDGEAVCKKYLRTLHKNRKHLDTKKLREAVKKKIMELQNNDCIAWWNVTPEELRHWRKTEIDFLATVTSAIREFDKKRRPIFMYEPGHRGASALAKQVPYLDIIGKGMYTNYSKQKNSRIYCRWSIEREIEAIKEVKAVNKIPIAIPEMFRQPEQDEIKLINSWVRHDVYCALAAGAKGVLVFSARRRPKFTAREKYLDAYLQVCRELQGELGQAVLFGKRKNDLTVDVLNGPKEVKLKFYTHQEKTYPSISIANLAYENARYLILVNSSDKPVEAVVDGLIYGSGVTVQNIVGDKSSFTAPEGQIVINFKPLEVVLYKITNNNK